MYEFADEPPPKKPADAPVPPAPQQRRPPQPKLPPAPPGRTRPPTPHALRPTQAPSGPISTRPADSHTQIPVSRAPRPAPEHTEHHRPADRIQRDLFCVGCGYNLRNQFATGDCPECGLAAAESFRPPTLADEHPA